MQNAEHCAYRKISKRFFEAIVVTCAPPLVSDRNASELHAPAGVTLSDTIRYHADRGHNNMTILLKDLAYMRMMSSLSIAMRSLLPDVEGDRARGLQ